MTQLVLARLGDVGGVRIVLDRAQLILVSSGEDAVDSIEYAAGLAVDIAESIDRDVRITWTERPPIGDAGRAEEIDGYWIPAQHVAGYRARQRRAFASLSEVGKGVDRWALEDHDGFRVAAANAGDEVTTYLLGVGHLRRSTRPSQTTTWTTTSAELLTSVSHSEQEEV